MLVGAPIWGLISDRLGRRRILIFGLVGYVASLLRLPSMGRLWTIYVLRAAAGLFVAAVVPVVPALVAAHTPKAIRARRFAWLGAVSLLGASMILGLALHQTNTGMYVGVSLTSAGTGLVLPVIAFLAAGGWLFGAVAQLSFAWLALPLLATLILLLLRPLWWKAAATARAAALSPSSNTA